VAGAAVKSRRAGKLARDDEGEEASTYSYHGRDHAARLSDSRARPASTFGDGVYFRPTALRRRPGPATPRSLASSADQGSSRVKPTLRTT
jgi:hypothetical protein